MCFKSGAERPKGIPFLLSILSTIMTHEKKELSDICNVFPTSYTYI